MSVRSITTTGDDAADGAQVAGTPGPGRSDAEVAERVDALIAQMTVAEKAGQLTQYFYFDLPPAADDQDADVPGARPGGENAVEAALARGEVGSLLLVADPAKVNRLQRLAGAGKRDRIPGMVGGDVVHPP